MGVAVWTSSGTAPLDEAAAKAVRRWRFEPRSGATADVEVPVVFRLKD
jgi:TonB family protein